MLKLGTLGVVVMPNGPPSRRWREMMTPRFQIDSAAPIDFGVDGEASRLEPPLRFESLPGPADPDSSRPAPPRAAAQAEAFVGMFSATASRIRFIRGATSTRWCKLVPGRLT